MRPTPDTLRALLDYNPETGALTWRESAPRGGKRQAGREAGTTRRVGRPPGKLYRGVKIDRQVYGSHVLAWAIVTGEWPEGMLDHEDGDGTNNRWQNLRAASSRINAQNVGLSKRNKLGVQGVIAMPSGTYRASIVVGTYPTIEEAQRAFAAAALMLDPDHKRRAKGTTKTSGGYRAQMVIGHYTTIEEAGAAHLRAKLALHEGYVPGR